MLPCKHPRSSNGRIPSDLFEVYVRYKQDTRAIVAWLIRCAPSKHDTNLSIQDLFDLARVVRDKAVKMPDNIAFHFREAIAARMQLSNFFRGASVKGVCHRETLNHEFFTMR